MTSEKERYLAKYTLKTLQREQYLAKCSRMEKLIREEIRESRGLIKSAKRHLQDLKEMSPVFSVWQKDDITRILKKQKDRLTIAKLALKAYKKMDRVVVPRDVRKHWTGQMTTGRCACGDVISSAEAYCMRCGRRILWEKVK